MHAVLRNGYVAEQGSHSELMDLNGIYANLAKAQNLSRNVVELTSHKVDVRKPGDGSPGKEGTDVDSDDYLDENVNLVRLFCI